MTGLRWKPRKLRDRSTMACATRRPRGPANPSIEMPAALVIVAPADGPSFGIAPAGANTVLEVALGAPPSGPGSRFFDCIRQRVGWC